MSTSADCIAKVDLSAQDLEDLERRVRDYQQRGVASSDAVASAAKDMIKELQKLRAGYEKQLADKGLTPPAPAKKIEGKIKLKPKAVDAPAPAPQIPEQAELHAKNLGGRVVFHEGDIALIEGFSVLTGRHVYVPAKGSLRARVDVRTFTGTMFTSAELEKLRAAADDAEAKDANDHDLNPDGPFGTDPVAATDGVDARYVEYLRGLLNLLSLDGVRVFLTHPEDVRAPGAKEKYKLYGPMASAMSAGLDANEDGSFRKFGDGARDFYISFKQGLDSVRAIETIAHEVGHLVQRVAYDRADADTKAEIDAAYKAWLQSTKGMSAEQVVNALRNVVTAEAHAATVSGPATNLSPYWTSFSEWFADNVSRWATTSEKPKSLLDKFFAAVVETYRKLAASITGRSYAPNPAVAKFLDAMAEKPASPPGVKFSKARSTGSTVARVQTEIAKLKLADNGRVTVVQSVSDLPAGARAAIEKESETGGKVQAFVLNGKAYLIADNIAPGNARAVFMHEVGAHLGIDNLLTKAQYDNLIRKLLAWADKNDGSQESKLARRAVERAGAAGTPDVDLHSEVLAYFVEEAVKAGIDPTALKYSSEIGRWFAELIQAMKQALRKLQFFTAPDLTPQDVVDLAYGAAKIELETPLSDAPESARASKTADRDANFKRWFGDSVVKNPDGSPKVMYHGTAQDIETFRPKQAGAIFVTDDPTFADEFAVRSEWNMLNRGNQDGAQNVIPVFVKAEKPFDYENAEQARAVAMKVGEMARGGELSTRGTLLDFRNDAGSIFLSHDMSQVYGDGVKAVEKALLAGDWHMIESREIQAALKALGHDSFYVKEDGRKNLAVYEPTQLKSATGNNGDFNPNDGRIQYSKAAEEIDAIREELPAERRAVASRLTEWANGIADAGWRGNASRASGSRVGEAAKRTLFGFMTNFQLAEQFGERITALKERTGHVVSMIQRRGEMSQKVTAALVKWDALPQDVQNRLNLLMRDATMAEIHPDVAFDDESNKHLKPTDREKYNQLRARYEALGAGKAVYQEAKAVLAEQWNARRTGYMRMVDNQMAELLAAANEGGRATDEKIAEIEQLGKELKARYNDQQGRVRGPYFPLLRFGNYLAIGESAELKAAEAELAGLTGKPLQEARERVAAMKREPKHYVVSAHDTRNEALAAVRSMRDRKLESRLSLKDPTEGQLSRETAGLLKQFQDSLRKKWGEGELDGGSLDSALEAMTKVYLANLPEVHALKRQAERRGIAGASVDMKRAFASAGQQGAFMASRMEFADALATDMANIKKQAKEDMARTDDANAGHVANEMLRRQALDMTYTETPVQDWLTTAGYTYYLGASPAFLLMNLMQPGMVSVPVLAGRFGMAKAASAMRRSYGMAAALLKDARYKDGSWDAWKAIDSEAGALKGNDKAHLRYALRQLMQRGVIDEGLQHELTTFAEGGNQTLVKAQKYIGWASQQVEIVNRLSTALAAYELAMEGKSPRNPDGTWTAAHDAAVEYAYSQTIRTQMDYSSESTARFMREGGGIPFAKMIFQFRRFQQGMLYLLADNVKTAFSSDPAEAKAARATLGWLFATTGLMAGALGMPFVGTALWLASFGDDEDDPEGTTEVKLRNALADTFGTELGTILAKGLPAALGADISKRVGLGDVASPFPMARFDDARTGKDAAKELLFNAAGPAFGMGASMWDGVQRLIAGDVQKGVEKLVPKMFADVSRGVRFGIDGMTDSKGNPIQVPLDAGDVFLRSIGVSPVRESNYYEGTKALRDVQTGMNDAKGRIGQEYREALRSGNFETVRQSIDDWNRKHPGQRITARDKLNWRRQEMDARKSATASGIKVDKSAAQYANVARFAQP